MIEISDRELDTVKRILSEIVPECEVRAFGSRVNGSGIRKYSDLDLAIVGEGKLDLRTRTILNEAFEESDLPFRVDVIDYSAVSNEFCQIVNRKYEVIQNK